MAKFILLTGFIGAGKSHVASLLRKKHYIVVDADTAAKRLYKDPEVLRKAVSMFGKGILADNGEIDLEVMRRLVFNPNNVNIRRFLGDLTLHLAEKLQTRYENTVEPIFIEAACTPEVQFIISRLDITRAIFVQASREARYLRLNKERGMDQDDIERIDSIQVAAYCDANASFKSLVPIWANLVNDGGDISEPLDDILANRIVLSTKEKFALYERYLRESPDYCKENAYCYSFYNMGGCSACPFPCGRRQALFERAERLAASKRTDD